MEIFNDFLNNIDDPLQRERVKEVCKWISENYPNLQPTVKWNQPMFLDHGTYIIGFSIAKHHLAVSPEAEGIKRFTEQIKAAGYTHTNNLFRIPWNLPVDYSLIGRMIAANIQDKSDHSNFWR